MKNSFAKGFISAWSFEPEKVNSLDELLSVYGKIIESTPVEIAFWENMRNAETIKSTLDRMAIVEGNMSTVLAKSSHKRAANPQNVTYARRGVVVRDPAGKVVTARLKSGVLSDSVNAVKDKISLRGDWIKVNKDYMEARRKVAAEQSAADE
jgi:hypothetical protein